MKAGRRFLLLAAIAAALGWWGAQRFRDRAPATLGTAAGEAAGAAQGVSRLASMTGSAVSGEGADADFTNADRTDGDDPVNRVDADMASEAAPGDPGPCEEAVDTYLARSMLAASVTADVDPESFSVDSLRTRIEALPGLEARYAAAVLDTAVLRRAGQIAVLAEQSAGQPHLVWLDLTLCAAAGQQSDRCPLEAFEERALSIDGQNSEVWAQVAVNRHGRGDRDGALVAMRQAATAAETNSYWAKTVSLIDRALAAEGSSNSAWRGVNAIGLVPAPRGGPLTPLCRVESARSDDWARACLAYGELLEARGDTVLNASIGLTLQELAYTALGDTEGEQAAEARGATMRSATTFPDWMNRLLMDRGVYHNYIEAVTRVGEVRAARMAREEPELILPGALLQACGSERPTL